MRTLVSFVIIAIACFGSSCSRPSIEAREGYSLIQSYSKELAKNNLFMIGKGGSFYDGIVKLDIVCRSNDELDVQASRKLILPCVEGFIQKINNAQRVRKFLHHFPFSVEDVVFGIIFSYRENEETIKDRVAIVSIQDGYLYYNYYDSDAQCLKRLHKESFDEALKIVSEEQNTVLHP